jgi:hypothetical protein
MMSNVFDTMLHKELIRPAQWQAANTLRERIAAVGTEGATLRNPSSVEATVTDDGITLLSRLLTEPEGTARVDECLETIANIISHELDSFVELYCIEDTKDPRAILRRQVLLG